VQRQRVFTSIETRSKGRICLDLRHRGQPDPLTLLTSVLVDAYSFKAPFWALSLEFLSPSTAAVGLAAINAIGSLIGGLMVNVYGEILERTGSTSLAMSPTAVMGIASALLVLMMARRHVCFDSPLSPDAPRA
jgi:hypothetical protein